MERKITHIILDIDGTMTDGGIYYDSTGNEMKKFSVKDGLALIVARQAGIRLMVLTGRECAATTRRMKELKIDLLIQNLSDKAAFLKTYMEENNLSREEVAYIGDDLNDLASMELVGFVGCPADSCQEVKNRADYISDKKGGHGAVRDIIERILRESGEWGNIVSEIYKIASI